MPINWNVITNASLKDDICKLKHERFKQVNKTETLCLGQGGKKEVKNRKAKKLKKNCISQLQHEYKLYPQSITQSKNFEKKEEKKKKWVNTA